MADEGATATVGRRWRLLGYGLLTAAGVYALGEAWRLGLWRQGSPGEGLFPFNTMEDIAAAFDKICSDYQKHSRAARAIAEEYFRAETVLAKFLDDLGL